MTRFYLLIVLIGVFACPASGQLTTYFIAPDSTAPGISGPDTSSHYVALQRGQARQNRLLVFLAGTGSEPKNYSNFLDLAAERGYHAIGLHYPNQQSINGACGFEGDPDCFGRFRRESLYGTPLQADISIDSTNAIRHRLLKLLEYLSNQFPDDGWQHYLASDSIAWQRVITAGHSQGSGHALFMAREFELARCLVFSGPQEFLQGGDSIRVATWAKETLATPNSRLFFLLHTREELGAAKQLAVIEAMGFALADTARVDSASPPYGGAQVLLHGWEPAFKNLVPAPNHNSTVVNINVPRDAQNQNRLLPAWRYLLDTNLVTRLPAHRSPQNAAPITLFPQPAQESFRLRGAPATGGLRLFSPMGQVVRQYPSGQSSYSLRGLAPGTYYLEIRSGSEQTVVPLLKE